MKIKEKDKILEASGMGKSLMKGTTVGQTAAYIPEVWQTEDNGVTFIRLKK